MDVPYWVAESAETWALWVLETFGLTPGGAAIELGRELWDDIILGRSTLSEISIDGERIN
jgi:hypothetical protein